MKSSMNLSSIVLGFLAGASFYFRDYGNIESKTQFFLGIPISIFVATVAAQLINRAVDIKVPS